MNTLTEEQLNALLRAVYLFGLEDGIRMPMQGEAAAKQVVEIIRNEQQERTLGRVLFLLENDCEVSRG